ncbi:putative BOI-related E3 ubiquitin-protein ligase 3 [Iris pallida]|nr:putative BOI-related E3 ubiquitin-protein ligase 3 [Iris pallida]
MAVQAQHLDELPMQQQHPHHHARTVFSGPQSDLTCCYASGSRKRGRGLGLDHEEHSSVGVDMDNSNNLPTQFRYEQPAAARVVDSTGTSTSAARPALSPLSYDLYSRVHQQNIELDNIIRLQNERLRLELEESRKRQCRALIISFLENSKVVKRLKEKERELEMANRRNAELEERLRQVSSENQMWFHVAKDNEALVSSLKSSLEQILLQNALGAAAAAPPAADAEEGYGDSEEGGAVQWDGAARETTRKCSVCSRNDAGVLLLPCRHLCVCKGCESRVETCPVCNGRKNACLLIFMS